jgi:diguanylate cyclase
MEQHASDIARETIKRLASRKQAPNPDNFRRVYNEVLGVDAAAKPWAEILPRFLRRWEEYQAGLTQAKKREALDRVLINFGNDPDKLVEKLAGLADAWGRAQAGAAAEEGAGGATDGAADGAESGAILPPPAAPGDAPAASVVPGVAATDAEGSPLAALFATYVAELRREIDGRWPDVAADCDMLAGALGRRALDAGHVEALVAIWRALLLRAEGDRASLEGLKNLVALLLENIGEMASDDTWFSGQIAAMRAIVSGELTSYALYDAENSLKELVARQKQLKGGLIEAKAKLKQLVSSFIDRVGEITTNTGEYHQRIESYSARIAQAEEIGELGEVIDSLSADMRQIQDEMRQTHEELVVARRQVEDADTRILNLETELREVSAKVREDQLTGALNRRGLDEAFGREEARAQRAGAPFSIALLDIDHFKKLNDSLGHQAGDQALVHLTRVAKSLLRPMDSLARYGGEEFLALLPNTGLDEAEKVMSRLQRELTKEYFLHDNQRVLITFSAGVAQRIEGESRDALIGRADQAMYRAKQHGRNRVERG